MRELATRQHTVESSEPTEDKGERCFILLGTSQRIRKLHPQNKAHPRRKPVDKPFSASTVDWVKVGNDLECCTAMSVGILSLERLPSSREVRSRGMNAADFLISVSMRHEHIWSQHPWRGARAQGHPAHCSSCLQSAIRQHCLHQETPAQVFETKADKD